MKIKEFEGCKETVKFIRIINTCFDILKSRSQSSPGFKKSINEKNITTISLIEQSTFRPNSDTYTYTSAIDKINATTADRSQIENQILFDVNQLDDFNEEDEVFLQSFRNEQ